jgi:probable HAF family extracellular repeat protein
MYAQPSQPLQQRWAELVKARASQQAQPQAPAAGPKTTGTYITIDHPGSCGYSVLEGINSRGDIIGFYLGCGQPYPQNGHNFVFSNGTFTDINPPDCFPDGSFLLTEMGINEPGDVVGTCVDSGGVYHGFLLSKGGYTSINPPGASVYMEAAGINPSGDIVGWYSDNTGASHGFLFSKGSYTNIDVPISLGAVPGSTVATAINPQGDIVGTYSDTSGITHGYLLSHSSFSSFDLPGVDFPYPFGISVQGNIVGWACCGPGGYLLSNGAVTVIDFPGAGSLNTIAYGINPQGDIVGTYLDSSFNNHGFLLTKN